jgi:predicted amino acid racemase
VLYRSSAASTAARQLTHGPELRLEPLDLGVLLPPLAMVLLQTLLVLLVQVLRERETEKVRETSAAAVRRGRKRVIMTMIMLSCCRSG